MAEKTSYEADQSLWLQEQIEALQTGDLARLDCDNLIEYLGEMARAQHRELRGHYVILLQHMLKYRLQPEMASGGWASAVRMQQDCIADILNDAPSLERCAEGIFRGAYTRAAEFVAYEVDVPIGSLPLESPWKVSDALSFQPPR